MKREVSALYAEFRLQFAILRKLLFSSLRPEWLWGPPSLLANGYQGLFSWE